MAEHESGAALERLAPLIRRWKTQGWTTEASGVPTERIDAIDQRGARPDHERAGAGRRHNGDSAFATAES
jgi:hypothetical protein